MAPMNAILVVSGVRYENRRRLSSPGRCTHIGDREGDIYELFWAARKWTRIV